jgi:hypothetical protein
VSIPGAFWNPRNRRWRAVLSGYGGNGYIGEYLTEAEAVEARRAAEMLIDGRYHDQATIEIDGDAARVPLWARRGVLRGWATIDAADVPLVAAHRWAVTVSGYPVARVGGRVVYLHRLILPGDGIADHISGERFDCRRANLRRCSQLENSRNCRPTKNRALYKGVQRMPSGRFMARIMVNRRGISLGRYDTPELAARAYDRAALRHFGEFARPNFPAELYTETPGLDVVIRPYAPQGTSE